MSFIEAKRHLDQAAMGFGYYAGACVPFALECILPPSLQLDPKVYKQSIRLGGNLESHLLRVLAEKRFITYEPQTVTMDNFLPIVQLVNRFLNFPDTAGVLCCTVGINRLHLISLQGPLDSDGCATVFDLGNDYQEQPITILYSAIQAFEFGVSDNLTLVSKGPNWPR